MAQCCSKIWVELDLQGNNFFFQLQTCGGICFMLESIERNAIFYVFLIILFFTFFS